MYKILIVEDEDIIRKGLQYVIDWTGIDCLIAGEAVNGEEGLVKISDLKPDIVLLDVNMPILNGIEMLAAAKEKHMFSAIVLSGYDDFNYVKEALKHEVCDYLLKPIVQNELIEAIGRAKEAIDKRKRYHALKASFNDLGSNKIHKLHLWETATSYQSKHVNEIIKYIQENYQEKISIEDLVHDLDMSTTYLNKKFKETTGYTFNEFLNRYRIQKAIEMIKGGRDKISMIALDVGYSNYRYFIKVFKKYTNLLPSDFMDK